MPIQNSFTGTNLHVGNTGVRTVIAEILGFRTQITRTDEIKGIGGWSDPMNQFLAENLGFTRETLAVLTDDPVEADSTDDDATSSSIGQAARQKRKEYEAKDETATLRALYERENPITADNIQMPASFQNTLPYDLSGKDPAYPQMSDKKFKSVFLKIFVNALDIAVKDLSTLACAEMGDVIPADQSAMIHVRLNQAYTILQTKGGRANMRKIPNGSDPESLAGKVGPEIVPVEIPEPIENP